MDCRRQKLTAHCETQLLQSVHSDYRRSFSSFLYYLLFSLSVYSSWRNRWKNFRNISNFQKRKKELRRWKLLKVAGSKQQAQYSILFKLQTNKDFNKEAFKATCGNLWRSNQGVTIKDVGQNLFIAIFGSEEHLTSVIDKSPWSFDKKLILMKRFHGDSSPANVTFSHSLFWIRIFNIPIKCMNKAVRTRIGNKVGELIMVDAPKSGLA